MRLLHALIARPSAAVLATICCLALRADLNAQQIHIELDPARTTVEFTLDATMHTVHGTFKLRNGSLEFDSSSGAAKGAIVLDATSGLTGNSGRDRKMHKDVLQSTQYSDITFSPHRIVGKVDLAGNSKVDVEGVLRVHGADHPFTMPFVADAKDNTVKATTQFEIPYQAWGMKNPSTLFLHVSDKVQLRIEATGRITQ